MPRRNISKSKRINRVKRARSARTRRRPRSSTAKISTTVHRRMVLFPNVPDATWLHKLTWFASVALQMFKIVVGVTDDLTAESHTVGSGSTIILGPGDFAALSPMAVPVTTTKTDNEVKALKTFPFERAALSEITVRIVPSVDLGSRGGMYAAVLIPIDPIDSTMTMETAADQIRSRYSCDYDDIIKNPNAKLSMVTQTISLRLNASSAYHNIRTIWSDATGYVNAFPTCALCIAFSDMASGVSGIESNYAPNKSLFEVHLRGRLQLAEPSELTLAHDTGSNSKSCYTPKLFTTDSASINYRFFNSRFDAHGDLDLKKIPIPLARSMLQHFDRTDLLPKLENQDKVGDDFERLQIEDSQ